MSDLTAETVPTRPEAPDVAELRRLLDDMRALATREGVHNGNRAVLDIIARVEPLLDEADALRAKLAHMTEARDNARAEVERLTAIVNSDVLEATRGGVRIPRFDVPYPGGGTTADFMRTMAERLPSKGVMGSNCSNTAASILAAYADALDALDGEADRD